MAVFMLNICKFNACGLTFKNLAHLIQHIEETHIDYDPHVVEQSELQQPQCIPLSYALRFLTDAARQEGLKPIQHTPKQSFLSPNSNKNVTPTGSEAEEGGDLTTSEPDDSNDSWTTSEEFSSEFILRYGSRVVNQTITTHNNNTDKPFACPVPGCKKRYKNVNGIKYHSKNGHKNDGKIRKAFKCACGKSYKTTYGLKNHAAIQHNGGTGGGVGGGGGGGGSSNGIGVGGGSQIKSANKLIKTVNENDDNISSIDQGNICLKIAKSKIPAIEDHGYIKSDRPVLTETDIECENALGILTPASTPPLSHINTVKDEQKPIIHQVQAIQKYFTNVNNSQRRKNEF